MRPKRYRSPIWQDVKRGVGGIASGRFVMNDGETIPSPDALLIDDSGSGFLTETEDGAPILIS